MFISECQQQLDCNKASVVECFYEYQHYSLCSWNLFCFVYYTHAYALYISYRKSMKRRNLEYFPLQCDRIQFTQLLYDLFVCEAVVFPFLSSMSARIYQGMNEQNILK